MGWALVLAAAVGAICGLWLHVLIYMIIASLVAVVFIVTAILSGLAILSSLLWGVGLITALAAGYLAAHLVRLSVRSWRHEHNGKSSPKLSAEDEYLRDQQGH
jgi:hypothetical protein